MNTGSDTCDAVSAEHTIGLRDVDGEQSATICRRSPGHDGPHVGIDPTEHETVQFTRVVEQRPPSEADSTAVGWAQHMLPELGTAVYVGGVDGQRFYRDRTMKLEAVAYGDDGPTAIRVRVDDDELAVIPWGRIDAMWWAAS